MQLAAPVPGLVVRYSYLWHSEYLAGREEGQKDRPCAIIAAIRRDTTGETRVLVLPITHTAPTDDAAVEIPLRVKLRLGLDEQKSWVVLSEWNEFVWPGPDLRRAAHDGSVAYGMLPPSLFSIIRNRFLVLARHRGSKPVPRT